MNEEWICSQLENLKIKENRLNTLSQLRIQLNALPSIEERITHRFLSAPEIYDCCLDDDNSENTDASASSSSGNVDSSSSRQEQVDIASDVLAICMANLSLEQSNLPQLLQRSLIHKKPQIRALALRTILKELKKDTSQNNPALRLTDDLLVHIIETLQQQETEVGIPALNILTMALEDHLDEPGVHDGLARMLCSDETIQCRLYELVVSLAKRSPTVLAKVETFLDHAFSKLNDDDILFQVNILEILVPLAEPNHGLMYLEKRKVFEIVAQRVNNLNENSLDNLILPSIIRFFGKVGSMQPHKIITGYPQMIHYLFNVLNSGDVNILPICFETLANLTLTQQGKLLLDEKYGDEMRRALDKYSAYLHHLSTDIKQRIFSSLELIFTDGGGPSSQEVSAILHQWFVQLSGANNHMQFLLDFCRNPFPEIKVACLRLTGTICLYSWGVRALRDTGGFVEFLLDRKIEFDKEAKFAKYEVIRHLCDSNETDLFDVQLKAQLRQYLKEGPYYVPSYMDLAVEGN